MYRAKLAKIILVVHEVLTAEVSYMFSFVCIDFFDAISQSVLSIADPINCNRSISTIY